MSISFDALDLNLLRVFAALYEERSVTKAASRIGIGQPAMSAALARLRDALGDPLFVRTGRAMTPTPAARQLSVAVCESLVRLRGAVEPQQTFVPRQSKRLFRIATTDYAEAMLFPGVMKRLMREAPGVGVRITRVQELFRAPAETLEEGLTDLAIGFFDEVRARRDAVHAQKLFDDAIVCITRKTHPRVRGGLTSTAFLEIPQLRVLYPNEEEMGIIDSLLSARGKRRMVSCTVPHFLGIGALVAASDLLAVVPERLARVARKTHAIRMFQAPIAIPRINVTMAWHERHQTDPAHRWLRDLITEVATA